ncbi:MAG TPA: ABC transporter [Clostridiales bacterium]|nr:ABC transporter [Clostridiales bacterium]
MAQIKIKNLTYTYPDKKEKSLRNINLQILPGEFVLIVGGSGSGKSSLIRSIASLAPDFYGGKQEGDIFINNKNLKTTNRRELVQTLGIVFQNPESQLVMTDTEQEIAFGLENIGTEEKTIKRRIMEVTSALSLSDFKNSFIAQLSGGQKQKVALASVLAMQPEILLLDEPTSQLDPIAGEEILTMVRRLNEENGTTVILVEQKLERCFHFADRILVMEEGKIVKDSRDIGEIVKWAVKKENQYIPPLSKLFAKAGYRDIPLTIKSGRNIIGKENLMKEESKVVKTIPEKSNNIEKSILKMKNIWFNYDSEHEVLRNINLDIKKGSFSVIMGENGGGKTTLLKILNGLLRPTKGKVEVMGRNMKKLKIEEISKNVGYLSQNPKDYLFLPTVKEEMEFTIKNLHLEKEVHIDDLLDKLEILEYKQSNPRDLSTGERQRVALATVLASNPKILLLDEPTRGLDYDIKEKLGKILKKFQEEGMTIIMVTHDIEFAAEYAEDVILLYEGDIIEKGNKKEVLTKSTFYSPQISRLFYDYEEKIVTLEEGLKFLNKEKRKRDEVI